MIQSNLKDIDAIYAYANGAIRELTQIMCYDNELWSSFEPFTQIFEPTKSMQSITINATGLYLLEAYGGRGYSRDKKNKGGATKYYAVLKKGITIYVGVGAAGTFNGGGKADNAGAGYGGGATHWGLSNNVLADTDPADVLCVAGGTGGADDNHGNSSGGHGGGEKGNNGNNCTGGGQTSGGTGYKKGSYGKGGDALYGGAGGGGWYGGGSSPGSGGSQGAGAGGSGYIKTATTIYKGKAYTNTTVTGGSEFTTGRAIITRIA